MTSKKTASKAATYNEEQIQSTVKKVGQWTPQSVAQKVSTATIDVNKAFADVNAQLQGVLKEYDDANIAVQAKKDELENIFSKENVLKNIDLLHTEHSNIKTNLEQEMTLFQANLENEKEQAEIQRQQDEAKYNFDLSQKRAGEEEAYQADVRTKKNLQRDADEARERGFKEREEKIFKQETEFNDLKTQVAAFPAKLDSETKKEVAIATNSVKRDYEHKLQLLQKDFDTAAVVAKNTEAGLQARLANNDNIITQLTTQLTAAQNKVSEIAKEALQSASNTKSLADVKDFMQNQNNGQSKSKQ